MQKSVCGQYLKEIFIPSFLIPNLHIVIYITPPLWNTKGVILGDNFQFLNGVSAYLPLIVKKRANFSLILIHSQFIFIYIHVFINLENQIIMT